MTQTITEEMKLQDEWYKEARKITPETLPAFIKKLTTEYSHDYGTICHACAAAAVAGASAIDNSPAGGITGFQGGAIMWEFMEHWNGVKAPARLLKYDNMLFPQYQKDFTYISQDTWEHLQKRARENLEKETAAQEVRDHWRSIADGRVPFGFQVESRAS